MNFKPFLSGRFAFQSWHRWFGLLHALIWIRYFKSLPPFCSSRARKRLTLISRLLLFVLGIIMRMKPIAKPGPDGHAKSRIVSAREFSRILQPYIESAKESITIVDWTLPHDIFGTPKFTDALRILMTRNVKVSVLSRQDIICDDNHRHGLLALLDESQKDPKLYLNFHMNRQLPSPDPPVYSNDLSSRINFIAIDGDTKPGVCLTSVISSARKRRVRLRTTQ